MVTRILWLRVFTGYGILVLLGIIGIEMLLNGIGLLVPIFIAAFVISLFVH